MQRNLSRRAMVATSLGALATTLPAWGGEARRTPNVVMIVGDDQGWPDFGFMGHQDIRTPRIDRLASEGIVFPNGYTPCSLCRASLATLLTGLFPHQHHICCNDPPMGVDRTRMHPFIRNAPALPRLLREANFQSLQTGKFWEGHFSNAGFTHGQTTNTDRHIAAKTPQIGRATMQPIYDFVDQTKNQPFFVWYAPMMPHQPHNPPERLLKRYAVQGRDLNQAKYFAMCEWFDETVGQLLDFIEQRKLTENTLVLFCIDNGWIQYASDQKVPRPSQGAPRGKNTPYDMGVRTPIIVKWPGRIKPGRHQELAFTLDLASTILPAVGLRTPATMQGVNLVDYAAGRVRPRERVQGEIYTHDCVELGRPALSVTHRWMREGDWKIVTHVAEKRDVELFNLARDPHERENVAAKNADRLRQLQRSLDAWVATQ